MSGVKRLLCALMAAFTLCACACGAAQPETERTMKTSAPSKTDTFTTPTAETLPSQTETEARSTTCVTSEEDGPSVLPFRYTYLDFYLPDEQLRNMVPTDKVTLRPLTFLSGSQDLPVKPDGSFAFSAPEKRRVKWFNTELTFEKRASLQLTDLCGTACLSLPIPAVSMLDTYICTDDRLAYCHYEDEKGNVRTLYDVEFLLNYVAGTDDIHSFSVAVSEATPRAEFDETGLTVRDYAVCSPFRGDVNWLFTYGDEKRESLALRQITEGLFGEDRAYSFSERNTLCGYVYNGAHLLSEIDRAPSGAEKESGRTHYAARTVNGISYGVSCLEALGKSAFCGCVYMPDLRLYSDRIDALNGELPDLIAGILNDDFAGRECRVVHMAYGIEEGELVFNVNLSVDGYPVYLHMYDLSSILPQEPVKRALPKEETPEKPVIPERFDSDGAPEEIVFLVHTEQSSMLSERSLALLPDGENDAFFLADELTERAEAIQREIGTKVKIRRANIGEFVTAVKMARYYGEHICDVIAGIQYFDIGFACEDAPTLWDFEREDDYLDLTAPWWNGALNRAATLALPLECRGYTPWITGDITVGCAAETAVCFVNVEMWKRFADRIAALERSGGYSEPYDIVAQGCWTIDFVRDLCALVYEDSNGSGAPDRGDTVGLILDSPVLMDRTTDYLCAGFNMHYAVKNENGRYEAALNSPYSLECYRKLYELYYETAVLTVGKDQQEPTQCAAFDFFAGGRALICIGTLSEALSNEAYTQIAYDVLPMPLYDRAQFDAFDPALGYRTTIDDDILFFSIPATAVPEEEIPAITATLELMGYYGCATVLGNFIYRAAGISWDPESAEKEFDLALLSLRGARSDILLARRNACDMCNHLPPFSGNVAELRDPEDFSVTLQKRAGAAIKKLYAKFDQANSFTPEELWRYLW